MEWSDHNDNGHGSDYPQTVWDLDDFIVPQLPSQTVIPNLSDDEDLPHPFLPPVSVARSREEATAASAPDTSTSVRSRAAPSQRPSALILNQPEQAHDLSSWFRTIAEVISLSSRSVSVACTTSYPEAAKALLLYVGYLLRANNLDEAFILDPTVAAEVQATLPMKLSSLLSGKFTASRLVIHHTSFFDRY